MRSVPSFVRHLRLAAAPLAKRLLVVAGAVVAARTLGSGDADAVPSLARGEDGPGLHDVPSQFALIVGLVRPRPVPRPGLPGPRVVSRQRFEAELAAATTDQRPQQSFAVAVLAADDPAHLSRARDLAAAALSSGDLLSVTDDRVLLGLVGERFETRFDDFAEALFKDRAACRFGYAEQAGGEFCRRVVRRAAGHLAARRG
jgi:hypothetical protein